MRVAVIGAGASGLASAQKLKKNGFDFEVFERNEDLGGTWYYTEETGVDKYGFPIYSCMYAGLTTNLPKEVMGYSDYKITSPGNRSYISQEEVLEFLNKYALDNNLRQHIKFLSPVVQINSLPNNRWSLKILDLPTKKEIIEEFDAVMICSGHFNEGRFPEILGRDVFKGMQLHSHDYRKPEPFTGKRVLVIGAGPSGMDIAIILSKNAQKVILSHHCSRLESSSFPPNVFQKPDVTFITETGATFFDGTTADVDCIIYCTGYKYSYPFLQEDSKIIVEDYIYVKPLYKMIINIEYPTMCFIGIPILACSIPLYDLQIRYYMEYLKGSMKLPSKEKMYEETAEDVTRRKEMGFTVKQYHLVNTDFLWEYYRDLSDSARIENIWPAITKLRLEAAKQIFENLLGFKNDRYEIIDKDKFVKL